MTTPISGASAKFRLNGNNLEAKFLTRILLVLAYLAFAMLLTLYLLDLIPAGAAIGGMAACFLVPLAGGINEWLLSRGVIELAKHRLTVRTWGGKFVYRWSDIAELRISSLAESGIVTRTLMRLMAIDTRSPLVEVRLKGSLLGGLWPRQWRTRVFRMPALVRKAYLFPEDVDGFVRAASGFLEGETSLAAQ